MLARRITASLGAELDESTLCIPIFLSLGLQNPSHMMVLYKPPQAHLPLMPILFFNSRLG
jgi:hypothetical protein